MTNNAAIKEVKKRWGKNGNLSVRKYPTGTTLYTVGQIALGIFFEVKGQGSTWEAAFLDADWSDAIFENMCKSK